jgi:hypothetical protein
MNKNKKRGSVIAYALIITSVVSIILVSILQYISSQIRFSSNRIHRESAFQVAEAGIHFYQWYLSHSIAGQTAQQIEDFWENGDPYGVDEPYEAEFSDPEGGAIGRYSIEVEPPEEGTTIVMVKSTGWTYAEPDAKRIIQVRFRRPSWSEYAILANDDMRFGPGTLVNGRIHSNDGIRFDGTATNIISSSLDMYDDPDHSGNNEFGVHTHVTAPPGNGVGNDFQNQEAPPIDPVPERPDVFQAGRVFPAPEIDFNGLVADMAHMKNEAQISGHGIYYDNTGCGNGNQQRNEGRHIILNGDRMTVRTVRNYNNSNKSITTEGCALNNVPIPDNGVVFVENDIWIEGTINDRRVTFVAADLMGGSPANIYVGGGNLLYTNFDGRDIIGLLAQSNIEVIKDSLDDLTLCAAMISGSGRIGRDKYTPFGCNSQSCEDHKGTITITGALATNLRYGFAYTNGTGYSYRILNFDNNLLYFPPPYYPTGTEYHIDQWEEL